MGRIYGLEALRGVAALTVAWYHLCDNLAYRGPLAMVEGKAYLAVDLFFVISGFVLARTYERAMPTPLRFAALRYRRLWLPIATGAVVTFGLWLGMGLPVRDGLLVLAAGLLLVPGPQWAFVYNFPAWSIYFELIANLLHAALLARAGKAVLAAIVAVSFVVLWLGPAAHSMDVGSGPSIIWGLPRVCLSYTMGVLLYRLNGDRTWLPGALVWPVVLAYPLALAAFPFRAPQDELLFTLVANPLVVLAVLALSRQSLALWLGAFSFPLYALHGPLLLVAQALHLPWLAGLGAVLAAVAAIALVVDPRWRRLVLAGRRPAAQEPLASLAA